MGSIYDWSVNSYSNQNSDLEIDWREGQAPSTVNNSARIMMARIAEFISDTQYILETIGDGKIYNLTLKSKIKEYQEYLNINLRFNQINKEDPTLTINNLMAIPLVIRDQEKGFVSLPEKTLLVGQTYNVRYLKSDKHTNGVFCVMSISGGSFLPTGSILAFAANIKEGEWLYCDGREVSRKDYPELAALLDNSWGTSTNKDNFKIPDLRGAFLRGIDPEMRFDKEKDRKIGSLQKDELKAHNHEFVTEENEPLKLRLREKPVKLIEQDPETAPTFRSSDGGVEHNPLEINHYDNSRTGVHTHKGTTKENIGIETRPVNYAIAYYIKT